MKITVFRLLLTALLSAAIASCGENPKGPFSSGDLIVNGPGFSGGLNAGQKRFYMLKNIQGGKSYTVRTSIGRRDKDTDGIPLIDENGNPYTVADGSLTLEIFTSESAFRSNGPASYTPVTQGADATAALAHIVEIRFLAAETGDFVVALSGESVSALGQQFFFDLRIMTAESDTLSSFTTPTLATSLTGTGFLQAGHVNIFRGTDSIIAGTYTINLISDATSTISQPQMFIYEDETLMIGKLRFSSLPTSTNFLITTFTSTVSRSTVTLESNSISGVPISTNRPYILLKGTAAVNYTVTINP